MSVDSRLLRGKKLATIADQEQLIEAARLLRDGSRSEGGRKFCSKDGISLLLWKVRSAFRRVAANGCGPKWATRNRRNERLRNPTKAVDLVHLRYAVAAAERGSFRRTSSSWPTERVRRATKVLIAAALQVAANDSCWLFARGSSTVRPRLASLGRHHQGDEREENQIVEPDRPRYFFSFLTVDEYQGVCR